MNSVGENRNGGPGAETCRVLVLDAGYRIRRLPGYLESDDRRFALIAFVDSEAAMRRLAEATHPDAVLAAVEPCDQAVDALISLARDHNGMRVVVQTTTIEPADALGPLRRAGIAVWDRAHLAELEAALLATP